MTMTIVNVISTVVPNETHFVVDRGNRYIGVLSYWLIEKVKFGEKSPVEILSTPIVDDGVTPIEEQIISDRFVFHWCQFMEKLPKGDISFKGNDREIVKTLLIKLWGE